MSTQSYIASPSVVAHAGRNGVDLSDVARKSGRLNLAREDVDSHLNGKTPTASAMPTLNTYWDVDHAAFGPVSHEPLSRMARVASANLAAANAMIPQVTHHDRADMRRLAAFRASQKTEAERRGLRLTALAFHVKALAICLQEFERFNASLSPDGETLVLKHYVHIGIAVDTPHGLMVPVIRYTDKKGLWQIAADITDLAARAQMRKIRPDEMGGASMSISNLGGIGGTAFTPIVNPPELAILGITQTETVPVWENECWTPVPMTPLDLSYDHRVINGADAARFMARYVRLLADPRRMVI
ncbi:pyruvate/2-oxoglutarate dehydrogenase complex, dihydrolipoamide acyltransferase component [Hoeflea sp. IMCC20628]|uniref:2-oxo acid dehydrogenase subunit E2 n=1 Tax=Hoeflea sp. IMCC20628 TaxID=1620421 RepID=UPI00063BE8B1|nr:2-oxo acid dehydrogenase subunit E2 [Hoeflea sp. IMCC20628]AKI01854.1 pyruvate/2-oxoglutarate dehydrogenase complex, dihydrolipoamide acyltransferase component [Hoeflea sp. IMCC20628]